MLMMVNVHRVSSVKYVTQNIKNLKFKHLSSQKLNLYLYFLRRFIKIKQAGIRIWEPILILVW